MNPFGEYRPTVGPSGPAPQPTIWTNQPVTTTTFFGSPGASGGYGSSSTTTDGATTPGTQTTITPNADGSVEIFTLTGLVSFTLVETQNSNYSTNAVSTSVYITKTMSYGSSDILLAADGTGYQRSNTESESDTYQDSTANGTSTFSSYVTRTWTTSDHEVGVGSGGSADAETIDNLVNVSSQSTHSGTDTATLVQVTTSNSDTGSDSYSDTDINPTVSSSENDSLSGSDQWTDQVSGTGTNYPNLTWTASETYSGSGSGKDKYNDRDEDISTTTPDSSTTLYDDAVFTDTGTDKYQQSNNGTLSQSTVDGSLTQSDQHQDSDSGTENDSETDTGWEQWNGSEPDLSVVSSRDNFNDTVSDGSLYTDLDVGTSGTAGPGTDTLSSTSNDSVNFNTSDTSQVTDTLTNQYGTPTVSSITGTSGDQGTLGEIDTLGDIETISPTGADLGDAVNFDDKTNEQDTATDGLSIGVTTNGQVGVGENLNSTESIELTDNSSTTLIEDDPGTANLVGPDVDESDTATSTLTTGDTMQVTDTVNATDTTTLPNGSVITQQANGNDSDNISDTETDGDVKTETEDTVPGGSLQLVTNDDDHYNDQSNSTDSYTQSDSASVNIVTPVPTKPKGTGSYNIWTCPLFMNPKAWHLTGPKHEVYPKRTRRRILN